MPGPGLEFLFQKRRAEARRFLFPGRRALRSPYPKKRNGHKMLKKHKKTPLVLFELSAALSLPNPFRPRMARMARIKAGSISMPSVVKTV
jgi:hypothetical protein